MKLPIKRILEAGPAGEAGRREGEGWALASMAMLLAGQKAGAATMFARGVTLLERAWRERNPQFSGGLRKRLAESIRYYEETHQNKINRGLHQVGTPLIAGGALGLTVLPAFSLPWGIAAGAFAVGWTLNIVGHAVFERNKPAFATDPLAVVSGPLWDLKQIAERVPRVASALSRPLLKRRSEATA